MAKKKILIVEDDPDIANLVQYNLEKAGYDCSIVESGEQAIKFFERASADLILLDIMLPNMDGLETCKEMKSDDRLKHIPIIMLTAKGEEIDRIVGFELGVEDYILKPFSPRELVLRVKAILKRGKAENNGQDILSFYDLAVDKSRYKVTLKGKMIQLTSMEFKLLLTLLQRKGRVQTRDRLLEDVWDLDSDVTTRTVDTHIKRLRQKLGSYGKYVETIRGYGYKLTDGE